MRPLGTLKLAEVRIGQELHRSPEEKNWLEGENCVLQFREVVRLSQRFNGVLALTP